MVVDIYLMIMAPLFIVPLDYTCASTSLLLIDLGQLSFRSDIDEELSKRIKNMEIHEKDFYDRYVLGMSGIGVSIRDGNVESQILEKVNINLDIDQCITPDTIDLPMAKVKGTVPCVRINISPHKLRSIIKIINNVMELLDSPTGVESKRLKFEGPLRMVKGREGLPERSTCYTFNNFIFTISDDDIFWCELRDGGNLLIYESKFARRRPIANINVVRNGVLVFDATADYGSRNERIERNAEVSHYTEC